MTAPQRVNNVPGAVLWMLGALLSFSAIAIAGREASRGISTTELMFWRSLIGIVVLLAIMMATGMRFSELKSGQPKLQAVRSVVHFGAQFSWLYALTLMPLVELFALEFTSPLWVALLAPLFLGEKITPTRIAAAIIGFIGALIVVQPGGASLSQGAMFALASALGFALSMISVRQLTKTDSAFTVLFWMNALQTVIGLAFLTRGVTWPTPTVWAWVFVVGIAGLTAHYSLNRAFALADAIIVAPMDFLRVPLIAFAGVAIYNEPLQNAAVIGGLCVLAANAINLWGERRSKA